MRTTTNIMVLAVSLGLASVSALYAASAQTPSDISANLTGSRTHSGMMGGGDMAGMMAQMREMTEMCNKMMAVTPGQSPAPVEPDHKG
jgi:hypothetical protein